MLKTSLRLAHTFIEAIDSGSIAGAGRALNITSAAASKNIQNLEDVLGVQLLNRTTRSITLTETGEIYYEKMKGIIGSIYLVEDELASFHNSPKGKISVNTSALFGQTFIVPYISEFLELYPDIHIDLTLDENISNITQENIDIAIRTGVASGQTMIQKYICELKLKLVSSKKFIDTHGTPKNVEDLKNFNCLGYRFPQTGQPHPWALLSDGVSKNIMPVGNFSSPNMAELTLLCEQGVGISYLPDFQVYKQIKDKTLIEILPGSGTIVSKFFFYYSERKKNSKSLLVFKEFFLNKIRERLKSENI